MSHSICSDQSLTTNNQAYSKNEHNYVSDDDDQLEATKQIEQILEYYRKELQQESNTQLDCNRRLITRLFDFIRPVYSSYRKKKEDLDALFEDISDLQDIRYIQQKEKTEQLQNEILHLKMTSVNEGHSSNDTITKVFRIGEIIFKIINLK
jgi:predicted RNase H-like nuclease (RuvC/YqgF family)